MMRRSAIRMFIISIVTCFPFFAFADNTASKVNMTPGVTPISQDVYDLHMIIFFICVAIGIIVFGVLTFSLIKYRKSRGVNAAQFHGNTTVEILWAVIPFIILVIMAIPATNVLIDMKDTGKADITIKVTGYQWKWKYDYLDQDISFFSNLATPLDQIHNKAPKGKWYLLDVDNPLVLPIHTKIRFLITSNDVIHSWWVPALGFKKDALPGFIHDNWAWIDKPGTYRGQCAELCGVNHGFMPIVIKAVTPAEFEKWVLAKNADLKKELNTEKSSLTKTWTLKELMDKGQTVYKSTCSVCHKEDGSGMPPTFPPLVAGKITTGKIISHISVVLNGVPGTAMQAFGSQLNDTEIAAVVTFERNSWGNDDKAKYGKEAGGIVQPSEVAKIRNNEEGE